MARGSFAIRSGFGNELRDRGAAGRTADRPEQSAASRRIGLYTEEINGTPFTAPRASSRRSLDLSHPAVGRCTSRFAQIARGLIRSAPFDEAPAYAESTALATAADPEGADRLRRRASSPWAATATRRSRPAPRMHVYAANASMKDRFFYDADGELLIVPQQGALTVHTELGVLDVAPGEICVVPRGVKFRVELDGDAARGYVCENYGAHFRLPELGPIGTSGLANSRDFLAPVAAFEDRDGDFRVVAKFLGRLWEAEIDHSPLDIVAWHGTYVPYKYDLAALQVHQHGDLRSSGPVDLLRCWRRRPRSPGTSNVEFGVIADAGACAQNTFRPPPFHRNVCSEFVGLVQGQYIGKAERLRARLREPAQLHVGPRAGRDAFERGSSGRRRRRSISTDTLTIIFETQLVIRPTRVRARDRAARARLLHALARARQALSARVVRPGAPGRARTNFRPPLERSRHAPGEHRTPCGARLSSPQAVIDFELGEHLVGVLAEQRLT